jgi:hypothetical protein
MNKFLNEADIKKWERLNIEAEDLPGESLLSVTYRDNDLRNRIKLPGKLFTKLIKEKRPEYLQFLPYHIVLQPLNESKKNLKNPYITKDKIIGIDEGDYLVFHVGSEYKPRVKSLLWLLLHEFRHKIQANLKSIQSTVYSDLFAELLEKLPYTEDSINHVFHEFLPYEVDANIFANEIMGIEYDSGKKWPIDFKRLKKKKKKK